MDTTPPHPTRAVFTLRIAGKPGAAGIHALRFLLKRLLRQHGFVALDVHEETEPEPITYTQVFDELHHDDVTRRAPSRVGADEEKLSSENFEPPF
jgi:hypothetical protein